MSKPYLRFCFLSYRGECCGRGSWRGVDYLTSLWSVPPGSGTDGSSTVGLYRNVKAVFFLAFILYLDENLSVFAAIEQTEPWLRFSNFCSWCFALLTLLLCVQQVHWLSLECSGHAPSPSPTLRQAPLAPAFCDRYTHVPGLAETSVPWPWLHMRNTWRAFIIPTLWLHPTQLSQML